MSEVPSEFICAVIAFDVRSQSRGPSDAGFKRKASTRVDGDEGEVLHSCVDPASRTASTDTTIELFSLGTVKSSTLPEAWMEFCAFNEPSDSSVKQRSFEELE